MDYIKIFLSVIESEKTKFNLDEQEIIVSITQLENTNGYFERPYDRCAYMYKYATCTLNFMKDRIKRFLMEYSEVEHLLSAWKSNPKLNFCSITCGPALDYLALTIAISECIREELQPCFNKVNVVSKSAQWKHALHFMVEAIKMGHLKDFPVATLCNDFSVIQDSFALFTKKRGTAVQAADVLFMMKTFNCLSEAPEARKFYFQEIVASMKIGSILFCIDTKPNFTIMDEVLCQIQGIYLYKPYFDGFRLTETFPDVFEATYGCLPIITMDKKSCNIFFGNSFKLKLDKTEIG